MLGVKYLNNGLVNDMSEWCTLSCISIHLVITYVREILNPVLLFFFF